MQTMKTWLKDKIWAVLKKENKALHIKDISEFFPGIPESTVRWRLNENVGSLFERLWEGFYILRWEKWTVWLIEWDARNLKGIVSDSSVDLLIADHPWEDKKAHTGWTKQFADDYDCFKYDVVRDIDKNSDTFWQVIGSSDFKEKARVMKEGAFLIEILPEKNATNRKYLRDIEDAAEAEGLEYFCEVPITWWNSNIGRKEKNISSVYFFTKGKARKLKIYSEYLSGLSKKWVLKYFDYKKQATDFFKVYYETLAISNLDKAFNEYLEKWELPSFKRTKKIIDETKLLQERFDNLLNKSVSDIDNPSLEWFAAQIAKNEMIIDDFKKAFEEFSTFLKEPTAFKSWTKKILPEFFKWENALDIRYQSQKPLNVYMDMILLTTNEWENIVEQYARSFVWWEATIELWENWYGWRNYLWFELEWEIVKEAKDYLSKKYSWVKLLTKDDFFSESWLAPVDVTEELNMVINKLNSDLNWIVSIITNNAKATGWLEAKNFQEGSVITLKVNTNKEYTLDIKASVNNVFELYKDWKVFKTSKQEARLDDLLIGIYNTFR